MTRIEHILTIVSEECSEIAQHCSKAIRFGLLEVQPGQTLTNASRIYQEYVDLKAAMEVLHAHWMALVDGTPSLGSMVDAKHRKIAEFLKYSAQCGILSDPVAEELE